jgi:hypothetical protein
MPTTKAILASGSADNAKTASTGWARTILPTRDVPLLAVKHHVNIYLLLTLATKEWRVDEDVVQNQVYRIDAACFGIWGRLFPSGNDCFVVDLDFEADSGGVGSASQVSL